MAYDRTVAAALSETKSKFTLAEALALDVPPRSQGSRAHDVSVTDYLSQARQSIIDAGGEPRSVSSLLKYRNTALWASTSTASGRSFAWVPGYSFSAHSEARETGLTFEQFAAEPKTRNEIRQDAGRAGNYGPPERAVQSWTSEQKASVAETLIREAPAEKRAAVVREMLADPVVAEQVSEQITDYVASDSKRTAEVISKRRQAEPIREPIHERPARDYDAMVENWVNQASVTLAAESSGNWTPNERSQALLYFMTQILGNRSEPTGEQADLVNDKLESLFSEVEAYVNSQVS